MISPVEHAIKTDQSKTKAFISVPCALAAAQLTLHKGSCRGLGTVNAAWTSFHLYASLLPVHKQTYYQAYQLAPACPQVGWVPIFS
jgi:hypothetical protein